MSYEDYIQMPCWLLQAQLSEFAENGITKCKEVTWIKQILDDCYPVYE